MPRSDFPDLLQVVINCSEYSSSCTEKRSKISLGTLSLRLRIGLPFVKTKTFLWVIYIPWVFSSNAALRQFPFVFLSAALQGTQAHVLLQLISLRPGYLGITQVPKSREGWIRVERQKAEPVLWKTSPCSRACHSQGCDWSWCYLVEHRDSTAEMALITGQIGVGVPCLFLGGLCCDKWHSWPQAVNKPSLNLAGSF